MSFLDQLRGLVDDPAPAYAFEISSEGIAWAARLSRRRPPSINFEPFQTEVVAVSPVKDNIADPETFARQVAALHPANGNKRRRDAALILPDYSTRIAVLDFDQFPSDRNEQTALVRFRMNKTVPFDLETAAVNFQMQKSAGKKFEVLVAAAAIEIVAKYEAPFRAAGYAPGFATTSVLAMMDLLPAQGLNVAVKLAGRTLTVAVCEGRQPKLVRCVEIDSGAASEVMAVMIPTFAYAEDQLGRRPDRIAVCGLAEDFAVACEAELGAPVEPLRSAWGPAHPNNAGLLGWLQAQEHGG